jgi:hypothetical protein
MSRFLNDIIDFCHTGLMPHALLKVTQIQTNTSGLSRVILRDAHTKSILVAGNQQKKVFFGGE